MFAIIAIAIVSVASVCALVIAVRTYSKYRGARWVTCPETKQGAAVEVDALDAVLRVSLGAPGLRLKDCNRWPEGKDCGQDCLRQIESSPSGCRLGTILAEWYKGKMCVYCGKIFDDIGRADHKPALMMPNEPSVAWSKIPLKSMPNVLVAALPVCWDCHVAETQRRCYPEFVVDRWRSDESDRKADSFWKETPWSL